MFDYSYTGFMAWVFSLIGIVVLAIAIINLIFCISKYRGASKDWDAVNSAPSDSNESSKARKIRKSKSLDSSATEVSAGVIVLLVGSFVFTLMSGVFASMFGESAINSREKQSIVNDYLSEELGASKFHHVWGYSVSYNVFDKDSDPWKCTSDWGLSSDRETVYLYSQDCDRLDSPVSEVELIGVPRSTNIEKEGS